MYASKAVAPTEIAVASHRVKHLEATTNDDQRQLELDLVDEKIWASEQTQRRMRLTKARYYNGRIFSRKCFVG